MRPVRCSLSNVFHMLFYHLSNVLSEEIVCCLCDAIYQANFADVLPAEQRVPDALAELGALTLKKEAR
jgi:monomeric isocitrate dehydrogenase